MTQSLNQTPISNFFFVSWCPGGYSSQEKIAQLFGVLRPAITKHLKNIFDSGELQENSVSSILEHTADDGKKYSTKFYNLDAIISVGYRVNSAQATHFRIWATQVLKEYIIKGFAMNDERLKNPDNIFGQDYFEEQLARIRDIRSSERRLYQKITDIYAQCSADYDPNTDITKQFFATVQNKLHFAITGKTAAEIISERVDSKKPNMGLTTWKYSPKGKIRETDVVMFTCRADFLLGVRVHPLFPVSLVGFRPPATGCKMLALHNYTQAAKIFFPSVSIISVFPVWPLSLRWS